MRFKVIIFLLGVIALSSGLEVSDYLDRVDFSQMPTPRITNGTQIILERDGFPYETHEVTSADGYILTIFRVTGTPKNPSPAGKKVVFLQHGLLCSSADWVLMGPGKALAYVLAEKGYDVWMGNHRGNTHSRRHIYLNPDKKQFWDYTWHEIGYYDLPAMIDYILAKTNQQKLQYIGHSQGTTAFFVMASMRPEYNKKIKSMHALAPVAFMGHLISPFIRAFSPFVNSLEWIMNMLGIHEFLPSNEMMVLGGYWTCRDESPFQVVCANSLFLIGGYNSAQMNRTMLPEIVVNTPAGAAVGQLVHYGQGVNSGKFRQYDHGFFGNLKHYGTSSPPNYPLNKVICPVALHFSDNDWLAANKDVQTLSKKLSNVIGLFLVPDRKFNHLDYMYGMNANSVVYSRVMSVMAAYD